MRHLLVKCKSPKMHRAGRLDTKDLSICVLALSDEDEPLTAKVA
ncbi:MAG TPA: hypothetical protein PLY87_19460 [Planctomycetaceae bacterium]|nr:hypothetical protein [Planctomycetaceae bacterium]